jgi:hypothetical protein
MLPNTCCSLPLTGEKLPTFKVPKLRTTRRDSGLEIIPTPSASQSNTAAHTPHTSSPPLNHTHSQSPPLDYSQSGPSTGTGAKQVGAHVTWRLPTSAGRL